MEKSLEIFKISEIIKENLPKSSFKIVGEVSYPKFSHGNLYFTLKDDKCSIKAILWNNKIGCLDEELKDGDKIVLIGKINYYETRGDISIIVDNIISVEGKGKMYEMYMKYLEKYKKLGYFDKIKKKTLPNPIKNILLVTSETGAAIQDFFYNINNNKSLLNCDILNVPVQGEKCPKELIKKLKKKDNLNNYDLIVITRGGGSFEDLFGFSNPKLIKFIYKFEYPVLSAIGHMIDNPILDLVADFSAPTPSLAGQFIIDHNKTYVDSLKNEASVMKNKMNYEFDKILNQTLIIKEKLQQQVNFIHKTKITLKENIKFLLDRQLTEIEELFNKLKKIEENKETKIYFGKSKDLDFDNILKNLKKNKKIKIVCGDRRIIISDYKIEIKE